MSASPGTSGTTVPDVLPASVLDGLPEAESWDVVVVGFGSAGGCAALEAARAGARVLLLERAAVHGGAAGRHAGGRFPRSAGETGATRRGEPRPSSGFP